MSTETFAQCIARMVGERRWTLTDMEAVARREYFGQGSAENILYFLGYAPCRETLEHPFGFRKRQDAPKRPANGKAAKPALETPAERKEHKLAVEDMPASMILYAGNDWRVFPGQPDMLIHRKMLAVQRRYSVRRGHHFTPVEMYFWKGVAYWRHWKAGVQTKINVAKAMYQVGFWKTKNTDTPKG